MIDKIISFYFDFLDQESDNVLVKMKDNDVVSSYVIFNSSSFSSQVLLQANDVSNSIQDLVFLYTDSYHQDASFWMNITLRVNLFASEPPVFDSGLNNIQINRWQNKEIVLPSFSDPDTPSSK